jgi:hypothetical protein
VIIGLVVASTILVAVARSKMVVAGDDDASMAGILK